MSLFDGMTELLTATFGGVATITPSTGDPIEINGILREVPAFEADEGARDHAAPVFSLQVRKPIPAALVKGATVTSTERPGETFIVRGVFPDRSPAADAFMVASLEMQT